jgi:hypothetical protein
MSFADTCADDFKIVDGTETITFTAVREGGNTDYSVAFADPQDLSKREIESSNGFFQSGDRRWGLGRKLLPDVAPQRGDRITDAAGVVWKLIGEAVLDALGISWVCTTRRGR